MPKDKPLVVLTRRLPEGIEGRMGELFRLERNDSDLAPTREALAAMMARAEVLVPTITDRIDAELIEKSGPQLRLIANFGNGTDNIDVSAAMKRGITVTNTPGVLTEDMADFTIAMMVAVSRRLVEGAKVIPQGHWQGWSPGWMLGRRIHGKRLGIIGMGRIGLGVARRARASRCIITTAARPRSASRKRFRQPTGTASTACSRGWILSPSIARTRPRPSTCSPRVASG
jgi:glyoxylate reductase